MATLTQGKKAPINDQDGNQLTTANSTVYSDSPSVTIDYSESVQFAVGAVVGTATLTATRLSDSVTATLSVEVVASGDGPAPFSISLGAEVDI